VIDRRCLIQRSGAIVAMLGSGMAFGPLRAFADTVTLPKAGDYTSLVTAFVILT
jgi:hypothetical protein